MNKFFLRSTRFHRNCLSLLPSILLPVFLLASLSIAREPVTADAKRLDKIFDSMNVEKLWIAGAIVNWRTGEPTGKAITDGGKHTHCSQFAAAVCDRLGIYLLHPPEHSSGLLANAQFDWLPGAGLGKGWIAVNDGVKAQDAANHGQLVVAVCKNPDPKKSGHTAVVRPGEKTAEQIAKEGPDVIQAGGHNYVRASLKQGFANHIEQYENDEIRFYAHPVPNTESAKER